MEQIVTLSGEDINNMLDFLDEEKDKASGTNATETFDYYPIFDDGNARKMGVVLLSIVLSGMFTAIGQLIAAYLMRDINNEIEVNIKGPNGEDVKVKLKNLTLAEVEEVLKDPKGYISQHAKM